MATAARASALDQVGAEQPPRTPLWIGGEWVEADRARAFEITSPASGETVGLAADGGPAETARAIEAARSAFGHWSSLPAAERGGILIRAADLLEGRREELARLIALEGGKPVAEARGEVGYAAGFLRFYAAEAEPTLAEETHPHPDGKRVVTAPRPVGVAGLITIWNFPAAGVTRPAGAALAAGCTCVIKPPEQTPLTAVAVCELLEDAGMPAGAVNLITTSDPAPVGREMVSNEVVRKLSFTGSVEVGTELLRGSAAQLKRVTLELGGQAPFIVFADADLEAAVEGAIRSKFRNSGQTCVCLNRLYAERAIYDELCERLTTRVRELRIGDPLAETTELGPLIDATALARVGEHTDDAVRRGARLLTGGRLASGSGAEAGLLFEPTVLADVPGEALVMREETFGPLLPVAPFDSEDEVIEAANALPWGLAAFLYSGDPDRGRRLADRLDFGVVGVNDPLPAAPHLPFGGLKRSGIGKEGGRAGIREFLDLKLISTA